MSWTRRLPMAALGALSALGCGDSTPRPEKMAFVHVEGEQLVDASGAPLAIEGIGADLSDDESVYAASAAMGMNFVRLYFGAADLDDVSSPDSFNAAALAGMDASVAWARRYGLQVVLALGVPPGGSSIECKNDAFWDSAEHQSRMLELWRMLATRYAHEPAVAGYSLLDIPNPNRSIEQWRTLAERAAKTVREVDRQHTLFVGRALSVDCAFDLPASQTFVRLSDDNVVYEFDRVQPWSYVAQLTDPATTPDEGTLPEFGPYPNEHKLSIEHDKRVWLYWSDDSRPPTPVLKLKPEETEWTKKTFFYTVTEPQFAYAVPALQADNVAGKVYFDDLVIDELIDSTEHTVFDLDIESPDGWYFWQGDKEGNPLEGTGVVRSESSAHRGRASASISGTTTFANLGAEDWAIFLVKPGATYRVTAWLKGEDIGDLASARVRLDFWGYSEALHGFDRSSLEEKFTDFRAWGRAARVPMAVSCFGTGRPTFENGRGGSSWISDMIDIMRERELGFVYWAYHDRDFGISDGETVNEPLVDLLTEKLR